jgi:hypothetical protein
MTPEIRKVADQMERSGYLPALRAIAQTCCAPFWWHGLDSQGQYRILHNGTVCLVNSGVNLFAVTAQHVFEQYESDLASDPELRCQFGSSTVQPERLLIERSKELDLATFAMSQIQTAAIRVRPYAPVSWPAAPVRMEEILLYGGYPGSLRAEKVEIAELPFQWFVGSPLSITSSYIKLRVDFEEFYQPLSPAAEINTALGGMSGGPVFRFVPAPPIERLELVGFVVESQPSMGLVYVRPAHSVTAAGNFDHDAAA